MAKTPNQRLKILYLLRFLEEQSDEQHPVSIRDMVEELGRYDITAERKSLYEDIDALKRYGADIVGDQGQYYLASRAFELPELKLLVDSVQASKFITRKKSEELIQKLEGLTSKGEARQLHRQVFVMNRVKTMNERIYYNVDCIHTAIADDRQIRFRYFDYGVDKSRVFRKDGAFYQVSPWALTWADENYYLVAYDAASALLRHYRVDKMTDMQTVDDPREGGEVFEKEDMARYDSRVFGMFRREEKELRLRFARHLANSVLDRFGQELMLVPDGDEHFTCTVRVAVSPQFYGWLCGFGAEAEILSPGEEAAAFRDYVKGILAAYGE